MAEPSIDTQSLMQQLSFEKEADMWMDAIAGRIHDNNQLWILLRNVPLSARRGLYNGLKPRLKFKVKPYILFV